MGRDELRQDYGGLLTIVVLGVRAVEEIQQSRDAIRGFLGDDPDYFSYPFGKFTPALKLWPRPPQRLTLHEKSSRNCHLSWSVFCGVFTL